MKHKHIFLVVVAFGLGIQQMSIQSQEAKRRWEMMNQIRQDKFDIILPQVMRENHIDMWITVMREGNLGPLYDDLGQGYVGDFGFYIFTDRGEERIERAVMGINGYKLERSGAYDIFIGTSRARGIRKRAGSSEDRHQYGRAYWRRRQFIPYRLSSSQTGDGTPYADRMVSAEKLVSDFRSRRVASELVAFGEAGKISHELAERALSNEVIFPGITKLEDVAWWLQEELLRRGFESSFGLPSIYITGPTGIEAVSNERIIQRGDLIMIDWGVGLMNFYTDMKRMAYVLKPGETAVPGSYQQAFDQAVKVRDIIRKNIKPGTTAAETNDLLNRLVEKAGFAIMEEFNKPSERDITDVIIGSHSVGNWGHGIGPSIAFFNPERLTYVLQPNNLLAIEFFAYTSIPEWNGKKLRIPLEDDGVVTDQGIQWLYPINQKILLDPLNGKYRSRSPQSALLFKSFRYSYRSELMGSAVAARRDW